MGEDMKQKGDIKNIQNDNLWVVFRIRNDGKMSHSNLYRK